VYTLLAYEHGTDRVFRNVGILNSDPGELPRRKHTTYSTRRKFEIKNIIFYSTLLVLIGVKMLREPLVTLWSCPVSWKFVVWFG